MSQIQDGEKESIGYWDDDPSQCVGLTCALIVHYAYSEDKVLSRASSDSASVALLSKTLGKYARVRDTSSHAVDVLNLVSGNRLRKTFDLQEGEQPELFFLFVMTHGEKNGLLGTQYCDKGFTVSSLYERLQRNPMLSNTLKLIFISACRGNIREDEIHINPSKVSLLDVVPSKSIEPETPINLNAVRVTAEPNCENFVTMFSCVEETATFENAKGNVMSTSFCECLATLEKDVSLDEFLTRIMFYTDRKFNRPDGFGQTPEIKIFKHRPLSFTRNFDAAPTSSLGGDLSYDWRSKSRQPLVKRKAHFYISSRSSDIERIHVLEDLMWSEFGFEVNQHNCYASLAESVTAAGEEADGCVFVFIVAQLSTDERTGEVCARIEGKLTPIKHVLYQTIGPTTGNYIGKPKVFVFLNTTETSPRTPFGNVSQVYKETEFSRVGTIHEGLLTLIVPQRDALPFFDTVLAEYLRGDKVRDTTFQQFFAAVQRRAEATAKIKPMVASTLEMRLDMSFPPVLLAKRALLASGDSVSLTSLAKLMNAVFAAAKLPRARRRVLALEAFGPDASKRSLVETTDEYTVFLFSGDAGCGASTLARFLAKKASQAEFNLQLTVVNLSNDAKFHSALRETKDYKACLAKCWRSKEQARRLGPRTLLLLDNLDGLLSYELEDVLRMVRAMAVDRVCLVVSARPEKEPLLRKTLQDVCPVSVVRVDAASRERQVALLRARLGRRVARGLLEKALDEIRAAGASDLADRISSLERVATFPKLAAPGALNVFALSEHVFDATIDFVLPNVIGYSRRHRQFDQIREKHVRELAFYSHAFFFDEPVHQEFEFCSSYGIVRVHESRVVATSPALAAYLCVKNLSTDDRIGQLPDEKRKLLENMWNDKQRLDDAAN